MKTGLIGLTESPYSLVRGYTTNDNTGFVPSIVPIDTDGEKIEPVSDADATTEDKDTEEEESTLPEEEEPVDDGESATGEEEDP